MCCGPSETSGWAVKFYGIPAALWDIPPTLRYAKSCSAVSVPWLLAHTVGYLRSERSVSFCVGEYSIRVLVLRLGNMFWQTHNSKLVRNNTGSTWRLPQCKPATPKFSDVFVFPSQPAMCWRWKMMVCSLPQKVLSGIVRANGELIWAWSCDWESLNQRPCWWHLTVSEEPDGAASVLVCFVLCRNVRLTHRCILQY